MNIAVKMIVLVLLIALAFVVNAYASSYFAGYFFPLVQPRPYTEMVSAAIVGSLAAGVVVAYPLVRLFPERFWIAALVISIPVLDLRGRDFFRFSGTDESRIVVMSVVEFFVYPTVILVCTWLAKRWYGAEPEDTAGTPE